jgi:hypothetical protein
VKLSRGIGHINAQLNKLFGFQIKRTRWHPARKPEWPDTTPVGLVEHFSKMHLAGWVAARKDDFPVKISLHINGFPVHSTWANVDSSLKSFGKVQAFYLGTVGVWDFCKKSDKLSVRAGDKILPIVGEGLYRTSKHSGDQNLNDLKTMLSEGYLFNRRGELQLSKKLDMEWQEQVFGLYEKVTKILKSQGVTPFLMYGSLLGQVREGGFIGHDDDFDLGYVSKKRGPAAARELIRLAECFVAKGFDVEIKPEAIHIHDPEDPTLRLDLFHLYFSAKGELQFPFGVAGTLQFTLSDWKGITRAMFAGHSVLIPRNSEKFVECIYGESWRTPIVGFNWRQARTRQDLTGIVPQDVRDAFNARHHKEIG